MQIGIGNMLVRVNNSCMKFYTMSVAKATKVAVQPQRVKTEYSQIHKLQLVVIIYNYPLSVGCAILISEKDNLVFS